MNPEMPALQGASPLAPTPRSRARAYQIGALLAVAAVFGCFVVRPGYTRLATARADLAQLQNEMAQDSDQLTVLNELIKDVTELRPIEAEFTTRIPADHALGDFLGDLGVLFERCGLENHIFQPRPAQPVPAAWLAPEAQHLAGRLQVQPVLVQCEGRFDAIFSCLRDLERHPRLTQIENFRASSDNAQPGRLKVEMLLQLYFMPGENTPAGR